MIYTERDIPQKTSRQWYDSATLAMPEDEPLYVQVRDRSGKYRLPFKVVKREQNIFHAINGKVITFPVVAWSRTGANE